MQTTENFDIYFKYHRQETSKDSNGSEEIFILNGKNISFTEQHWGFKSEKKPKINDSRILSDKDLKKIVDFINEKKLNTDINQKIEEKQSFSFNTFTYTLINNLSSPNCTITLETNTLQSDNKLLLSLSKLNTILKLMFI